VERVSDGKRWPRRAPGPAPKHTPFATWLLQEVSDTVFAFFRTPVAFFCSRVLGYRLEAWRQPAAAAVEPWSYSKGRHNTLVMAKLGPAAIPEAAEAAVTSSAGTAGSTAALPFVAVL
jgi:hypothetical protein